MFSLGFEPAVDGPSHVAEERTASIIKRIFFPFYAHLTFVYSDDACRFTWNVCDFLCMVSQAIKRHNNHDSRIEYQCLSLPISNFP